MERKYRYHVFVYAPDGSEEREPVYLDDRQAALAYGRIMRDSGLCATVSVVDADGAMTLIEGVEGVVERYLGESEDVDFSEQKP